MPLDPNGKIDFGPDRMVDVNSEMIRMHEAVHKTYIEMLEVKERVSELEAVMKKYVDDVGSADPTDYEYIATSTWGYMKEFKKILAEKR